MVAKCPICKEITFDWEPRHVCKPRFYAWNDDYGTGGSLDAVVIFGSDAADAIENYACQDFEFPDGAEYYVLDAPSYNRIADEHADDEDDGTAVDNAMTGAAAKYTLWKEISVSWDAREAKGG